MAENAKMKCVVVGAGPVGALTALYAARRGHEVDVFDLRGDLRDESTTPLNFSRSINLALSERGINAIRHADSPGLLEKVLDDTIPMYGRMIHGQDSSGGLTEESQLYDVHGRYQRAVDRGNLNKILLDAIADLPNVRLHFFHKLTGADFRKRKAWFEQRTANNQRIDEIEVDFDLLLGCDGAHSRVRYHLNKFVRQSYSQSYIDVLWCEFTVPPASETIGRTASAKDGFATSPNHLHIWPSKDMMFIAIPSIDKTFTCTLFAPSATFAYLENNSSTIELFFNTHFPGAASLIGPANLANQFTRNPHLPLISVKCTPHHFSSTGVILGDAAHAMVPFYGQGMNAGLEDVRVLFSFLDKASSPTPFQDDEEEETGSPLQPSITNPTTFPTTSTLQPAIPPLSPADHSRAKALTAYTAHRVPDAHTINDLAFQNYWEMHAGVQSKGYLLRKRVEELLADYFPGSGFETQYSRVSFSNQRYSEVVRDVERQGRVLVLGLLGTGLVPFLGVLGWGFWRWHRGKGGLVEGVMGLLGKGRAGLENVGRSVFEAFGRGRG